MTWITQSASVSLNHVARVHSLTQWVIRVTDSFATWLVGVCGDTPAPCEQITERIGDLNHECIPECWLTLRAQLNWELFGSFQGVVQFSSFTPDDLFSWAKSSKRTHDYSEEARPGNKWKHACGWTVCVCCCEGPHETADGGVSCWCREVSNMIFVKCRDNRTRLDFWWSILAPSPFSSLIWFATLWT